MKIKNLFKALLFTIGLSLNSQAQIAVSKILVLPQSELNQELWFKLNEPSFPETTDTVRTRKNIIDFIRQTYADGSTIISDYHKNGELMKVSYMSKEDLIEVNYKEGKMNFILPKKWGVADSTSMRYDYVWHGQIVTLQNEKIKEVWEYKMGKMQSVSSYSDGRLIEKKVFMNGYKDYMRMEYFDNGKVLSSVRFVKNKVSGKAHYYFKDGEPLAELDFLNGKLDKGKIYKSPSDTEGTIITKQDPDAMWYHCAPDGSFCCECHTRKGIVKCKPIKQKQ
ncbi:MAG: toxin-antitoxin system YwqK family antitoxin [Flavobacteriales bacterium]